MRLGIVIEETWRFFEEIYEDLTLHHQTSLFRWRTLNIPILTTRINRYMFNSGMQSFFRQNDVVFFEWASGYLAAASQLRKQSGIVVRLHRYEMYQWVDEIDWEKIDKIILVSQAKKREFADRFPKQAEKIVVIPEAVDVNRFHPQNKIFNGNIGILCDLTPRKRVYDLILCFYELSKFRDGFHLHIGGGEHELFPDYYLAIESLIRKLNLQDNVTLYSNVTQPEDWYQDIDIFISNSYSEGLQVAPMEAMASGCYCLSHHWEGANELLPEENLYYSSNELIEKILCFSDAPESEKRAQKAQMRSLIMERFDINQTKVQIRNVLEEIGGNQ